MCVGMFVDIQECFVFEYVGKPHVDVQSEPQLSVFTGHCALNEHVCACVFVPVEDCYGGVCRLACHEARGTNPLAPHCRIQVK